MKEELIIALYCLCYDYLRSLDHEDWPNTKLSTEEVMLICLLAMKFFYGNFETTKSFMLEQGYISKSFSSSCLNKRLHKIPIEWWHGMLEYMFFWHKNQNMPLKYVVDAFPIFCL